MSEILISGVIVGPEEASFWRFFCPSLFEDGTLTASDDVIRAVNAAEDGLRIFINSYGGDVMAGKSISVAIKKWCASHPGKPCEYEIGALAASMAAALVVLAPRAAKIHAFDETTMMFHSATTCVANAGPGELKDTSERLTAFNELVKNAILARTDLDENEISEWFQDGRAGWISSARAVKCGMVDDILEGMAGSMPPKLEEGDVKASDKSHFSKIAAVYNSVTQNKEPKMKLKNEELPEEEKPEVTPEEETTETAPEETPEEKPEEENPESTPEEKPEEDSVEETIARLREENAALKAKLKKLTAGFKTGHVHQLHQTSFETAFLALKQDRSLTPAQFEDAYVKLREADPKGFEDYINKQKRVFVR